MRSTRRRSTPSNRRPSSPAACPIVPAEIEERLRQYQNTRTAVFHGWSPDGKGILIATRFGNTAQLHRVYEPGGRREQITFFDEPATGRFIPHAADGALLLSMSEGGSERDQIYLFDTKTGRAQRLTDGRSRNEIQAVTRDGSKLAFASNARNGRDTDLYVIEPRVPGSLKLVLKSDGQFWQAEDWSADGTKLLILRYVSINESYPAILDVATGEKQMLPIPGKSPVSFESLRFSPDSQSVYLATRRPGRISRAGTARPGDGALHVAHRKHSLGRRWDRRRPSGGTRRLHSQRERRERPVSAGRRPPHARGPSAGRHHRPRVFARRQPAWFYARPLRRAGRRLLRQFVRSEADPLDVQ